MNKKQVKISNKNSHTHNNQLNSNESEILYSKAAKPLNFSFRELFNMTDLLKVEPRSGIRKSIAETNNDNKEAKENKDKLDMEENFMLDNQQQAKRKKNEQKEDPIIESRIFGDKVIESNKVKGIKKQEEVFEQVKTTKKIKYLSFTNAIILHSNKIKTLNGVDEVLQEILPEVDFLTMISPKNDIQYNKIDMIQWLDLSHNKIESIHSDLMNLKFLKIFYCHANYVKDLSKVTVLGNCKFLLNLTLHGNPIEQIKGYRFFVIEMMKCLEKLDFTLVSEKELDIIHHRGSRYGEKRDKKTGRVLAYPTLDEEILKRMIPKDEEKKDI